MSHTTEAVAAEARAQAPFDGTNGRLSDAPLALSSQPVQTPRVLPEVVGLSLGLAAQQTPADRQTFTCSPETDQLIPGLVAAQSAFGEVERILTAKVASRREGAQGYQYDYAPLSEVLRAVRPALNANGIWLAQPPLARAQSVVITTLLAHTSGQWFRNDIALTIQSLDPQAFGSLVTYLRRYAVMSILGVAPEDGEDNDGVDGMPKRPTGGHSRPSSSSAAPSRDLMPARSSGANALAQQPSARPAQPAKPPAQSAPIYAQQPGLLTVGQCHPRQTQQGTAYWALEMSDGRRELVTFDRAIADNATLWSKQRRPIADLRTHTETSKTGVEWLIVDAIRAK